MVPQTELDGDYKVERKGIWKLRIANTSANLREMSKGEQRSELLMDRARKSLARSDSGRKGRRTYARDAAGPQDFRPMRADDDRDSVPGGALFSTLLRHSTMETERDDEERSLAGHAQKEAEPHRYFASRYPRSTGAMPPGVP